MPSASLTTHLSPLSPLLAFTPISADWTVGWNAGWDNIDAWDGQSTRWTQAWAVGRDLNVEASVEGSSISLLVTPTSYYNVSLFLNGTLVREVNDLSQTRSCNLTDLPEGTHDFRATFLSVDAARKPSQAGVLRVLGLELGWDGSSVSSQTLDADEWQDNKLSYSQGWNLLSSARPGQNIDNTTEADALTPNLSKVHNGSISWADFNGSSLTFTFSGNYITLRSPLSHSLGTFIPVVDGVDLSVVKASRNVPLASEDPQTIFGDHVTFHRAGLADGQHTFSMVNLDQGMMMADWWEFGTVSRHSADEAGSSTWASASSASSVASPSSSSASFGSTVSLNSISLSKSIGIWVAVGVGALAVFGLLLLLIWRKCRNGGRPADAPPSSDSAFIKPVTTTGQKPLASRAMARAGSFVSAGPSNPAPFSPSSSPGAQERAFQPLVDEPAGASAVVSSSSSTGGYLAPPQPQQPQQPPLDERQETQQQQQLPRARTLAVPGAMMSSSALLVPVSGARPVSEAGELGDWSDWVNPDADMRATSEHDRRATYASRETGGSVYSVGTANDTASYFTLEQEEEAEARRRASATAGMMLSPVADDEPPQQQRNNYF